MNDLVGQFEDTMAAYNLYYRAETGRELSNFKR